MRYSYLQIEKYIADKITSLCEKRDISKYRLSQQSGISQSSLGRIMTQENLPSLITLEKICTALGVTLSQFFQESNSENLTEKQKEVLQIWNDLSTNEQETVMSMLRGLRKQENSSVYVSAVLFLFLNVKTVMFFLCTVERYSIIKSVFLHKFKS